MVQDIRKIILSPGELVWAFEAYRRITPGFLPVGKVVACRGASEATVIVTLETWAGDAPVMQEATVRGVEALKPLIRFCLDNKIMLPKSGRKSFAVIDNRAVLCTTMEFDIDVANFLPEPGLDTITPADITYAHDMQQVAAAR